MFPEVDITPIKKMSDVREGQGRESTPANASGTNVKQNLTRARLWSGFLNKVDLMIRIVEGSNIGTLGRFLALCEDLEVRVVKDLARIVDIWVYRGGHGGRNKHVASLMAAVLTLIRSMCYWESSDV
jgi:hypothetical protein